MPRPSFALALLALLALLAGSPAAGQGDEPLPEATPAAPQATPDAPQARLDPASPPPEAPAELPEALEPPGAPRVAEIFAASGSPPVLEPVPAPSVEGLEPAVVAHLAGAFRQVEGLLRSPESTADQWVQAYGELGQILHAYEFFDSAAVAYGNARRADPRQGRWTYQLARLEHRRGELDRAITLYRQALASFPDDRAVLVHLGEALMEADDPVRAASYLERALEVHGDDPAALAALGELALSQGDAEGAIERLEAALALVPQADRLHYPLGLAYRETGDLETAREHLERAGSIGITVVDPLDRALLETARGERVAMLRGRQAFAAGDYTAAAQAFHEAAQAAPESATARINLGTALAQVGQAEAAIAQLLTAVELDPDRPMAHANLGVLLRQTGRPEEARGHLQRAVDLDPDDTPSRVRLARELAVDDPEGALAQLDEAMARSPQDPTSHLLRAEILAQRGRFDEVRATLDAAREALPQDGSIAHALAFFLATAPRAELRDGPRAVELADAVVQANPRPEFARTLAMAYAEAGDCEEAARLQRGLVAMARDGGLEERARQLALELAHYEAERPCRQPFSD